MPLNSIPVTTTVESLEQKVRAAAGHATVDYAFWGGVVPGNTAQLAPLAEAGVAGFKCFLVASGIDEFPSVSAADLYPAMTRLAELRLPLLVHAELPGPIARAARSTADSRRYASWLAARPPEAELEAIDLALGLCRKTGCPVPIGHLAAPAAFDRLRAAPREGRGPRGVRSRRTVYRRAVTFAAATPDHAVRGEDAARRGAADLRARKLRVRSRSVSGGSGGQMGALREGLIDLAAARLGGNALLASDEFFAPKSNLLEPGRGVFIEGRYTKRGKWMDGWETRRRRRPGYDWCIIRIGAPGVIRALTVDTNHFRGNHPAEG